MNNRTEIVYVPGKGLQNSIFSLCGTCMEMALRDLMCFRKQEKSG